MDKEDALALLDVMRMQAVHEPPRVDKQLLARAFADTTSTARQGQNVDRAEAANGFKQIS